MLTLFLLLAQEARDGVYLHEKHGLKLAVPDKAKFALRAKDFQLDWGQGTLLEIGNESDGIHGVLLLFESRMKVRKYADWREESWRKVAGVKDYKRTDEKTLERKVGEWLLREHRMAFEDSELRYVSVSIGRGRQNIELVLWTLETLWEDNRDAMHKIAAALEYAGPEKEVVLPNPWKGSGKGSWVKYKVTSENRARGTGEPPHETEQIHLLVDQDEESYTVRVDTVARGNRTEGQPVKVVLKQKIRESDPGQTEEGEETVKVAKGEFKCRWKKITIKDSSVKTCTSDAVLLGLVRSEAESGPMFTVMELVDWLKK